MRIVLLFYFSFKKAKIEAFVYAAKHHCEGWFVVKETYTTVEAIGS